MLRFLFIVLLLANALVFAYHRGHLNELAFFSDGREPARLQNQLNAQAIQLVVPAVQQVSDEQAEASCMELGNFSMAESRRAEPQLAALAPEFELVRREVTEASSHMVLVPPLGSRTAADQRAAELRQAGITDLFVLPEPPEHRWGISLGVFKNEEMARNRLATVMRQGAANAQIVEHKMSLPQIAFQLRGEPAALTAVVDRWRMEFPRYALRTCD